MGSADAESILWEKENIELRCIQCEDGGMFIVVDVDTEQEVTLDLRRKNIEELIDVMQKNIELYGEDEFI